MRMQADLSHAVKELKKLHTNLLDVVTRRLKSKADTRGLADAYKTVVSVIPGDRRREEGWYKYRAWDSKTESMLSELDHSHKAERYHEVFIAGEALSKPPEELVVLMMHQIAHQAAGQVSNQSYHSEWMRVWLSRLFGIPEEAVTRHDVLGWVGIDWGKLSPQARRLIESQAKKLKPENLDLYRGVKKGDMTTGKMYLWHCDCPKAPRLRTGGVPQLACQVCGGKVKFRDALKVSTAWLDRIPEEYRG